MDLDRTIRDLLEERKRLDTLIARIEQLQTSEQGPAPKRRGRKAMTPDQRLQVSERMKRYWEQKRRAESAAPEG